MSSPGALPRQPATTAVATPVAAARTEARPQVRSPGRAARIAKTALDYAVALPALLLALPVLLVAAVLLKRDSPGPVVYRRRVIGRGGRPFDAFKLRTMVDGAEMRLAADRRLHAAYLERHKLESDPRVTRVGRWLRRSSIDELPQLWNVLAGQMSLVGPRMITAEELPRYGDDAPLLLSIKPGITGPWQVSGRAELGYAQRVELDLRYVRGWSLGADLRILLLDTLPAVVRGRGAY
jgi:lipopolysaccharide/colanic/teichoic acid biosynthesis glycosyltransferase